MEINKSVDFSNKFSIKTSGNLVVELKLSKDNFYGVFIKSEIDIKEIYCEINPSNLIIKDKLIDKRNKEKLPQLSAAIEEKSGLESIIVGLISDVLNASSSKNDEDRNSIYVQIFLPSNNFNEISINSDNLQINFEGGTVDNLSLKSANLKINLNDSFKSKEFKIKAGNIHGQLSFGTNSKNIQAKGGNGRLKIARQSNFNGAVCCTGNNIKVKGSSFGLNEVGLCEIDINNGKIDII